MSALEGTNLKDPSGLRHTPARGLSLSRLWWPADLSAVAIRGATLTSS